ncbi:MAG: nickel pincer cofactor biosynthesis protein LarC [Candidatus Omnitrophica bacterium]|nr:nickel pincer cofactor biosynthesis protein LarC [Candidatus Omnitrophota bacterium]
MKIAILDCFNGISGDMTVAAFLDAGLSLQALKKELKKLDLNGYKVTAKKVMRGSLSGTKFDVLINKKSHYHMSYNRIADIINRSRLDAGIKKLSFSIFDKLAAAEAKVHNIRKDKVCFHEIGDLDSIIDIVATAAAVRHLGIEKFYCLNLKLGKGSVRVAHGEIPLPAPATMEMLRGKPVSFSDAEHELVTPTGAAILSTLVEDFNSRPDIKTDKIGYGAGAFDAPAAPNLLRIIIGEAQSKGLAQDEICVVESNIDDMSPVHYEYLMERLFENGALDVYLTPVYMKKTRPAVVLTVLAHERSRAALINLIMRETTTSGVRFYRAERRKLDRAIKVVKTKYGPIRVKINTGPGIKTASPEYDDCRRAAKKTGAPLKDVIEAAKQKLC